MDRAGIFRESGVSSGATAQEYGSGQDKDGNLLQVIRLLKNYDFVKGKQLDLFEKRIRP